MKDEKYSSCTGRDTKSEILKVRWKGWKIRNTEGSGGKDARSIIPKVRWNGWKVRNTEG